MSLLGAMTTAISGLTAQSKALGHVSDNVANSQTVGFKRIDTNFVNYLTRSTNRISMPGSVEARPDYTNSLQGTVQQTDNPLAMAVAGQGFFAVVQSRGSVGGVVQFDPQQYYTRAGDFRMDKDGYLVNGQSNFLQGWTVDQTGQPDRTQLTPIRISDLVYNPVATSTIDLSANLPADLPPAPPLPTAAQLADATVSGQIQVYDALGRPQQATLNWTKLSNTQWQLGINMPGEVAPPARSILVNFGPGGVPVAAAGTIESFGAATNMTGSAMVGIGDVATVSLTADFGQGLQPLTLNLGARGESRGVTQFAGTEYSVRNLAQDGVPLGSYAGVSLRDNGDLAVNYDNGQNRIVARVPIVAFNDPDRLQRQDGQAFTRTTESGEARIVDAGSSGAGKLVTSSVERSNVDIASEFSKLILAQRAYTANTRIVTAADEMLQDTLNMRR